MYICACLDFPQPDCCAKKMFCGALPLGPMVHLTVSPSWVSCSVYSKKNKLMLYNHAETVLNTHCFCIETILKHKHWAKKTNEYISILNWGLSRDKRCLKKVGPEKHIPKMYRFCIRIIFSSQRFHYWRVRRWTKKMMDIVRATTRSPDIVEEVPATTTGSWCITYVYNVYNCL